MKNLIKCTLLFAVALTSCQQTGVCIPADPQQAQAVNLRETADLNHCANQHVVVL